VDTNWCCKQPFLQAQHRVVATTPLALRWNARFTKNGMCAKINNIYTWHDRLATNWYCRGWAKWCNLLLDLTNTYVFKNFGEYLSDCLPLVAGLWRKQAITEWSRRLKPQCEALRTCCSGIPIATKWCCDQDVKVVLCEAITKRNCDRSVRIKRRGYCCNHSSGVALKCAVQHESNVREEQHHIYVARASNNRVISSGELYCCLLPQCETLRTYRSGFPITTRFPSVTYLPQKTWSQWSRLSNTIY